MSLHRSVREALTALRERWPGVPLAAFGQTVFWDEPMKCVLVPMLEAHYPGASMLLGTHDADYFGRCPGMVSAEKYVICEKNDGPTRDLWASVGEVSALFGAEIVPTRARLAAAGVNPTDRRTCWWSSTVRPR